MKKYYVEIDGNRYPKNFVNFNYAINDYLDQYRDHEIFYEDLAKEPLLKPFIKYTDTDKFYPKQAIDLRFQRDFVKPKKNQLLEENVGDPDNAHFDARLFTLLIRRRELKMVSNGNRITEIKDIYMTKFKF